MARHDSILEAVGNTPLVRLHALAPRGVNLYVKVESFNPMGSVKDRMALAVIEEAERSGRLKPGQTVIEATSGNTGIALAMVCARKGYPLVVTMAESFSLERRKMLRFLGAKVVLTPAAEKGTGMLAKAEELAAKHGWFLTRQFDNPANAEAHTRTTAREILADLEGEPVDYFVSGFGTGGTLLGVARGLKQASPNTRVVAAEPDNSPVLGSGIPQERGADGKPSFSHPMFRPHVMQGWSPDFISGLTESAVAEGLVDEVVPVAGDEAMRLSRELARREGIFVGTTSGATLAAALAIAERAPAGSNIVCMLPDTGERYLSTPLFDGIGVDMNAEEEALSASTPSCRFEAPSCPAPKPGATVVVDLDPSAKRFVDEVIDNEPAVMFALEWCEFSWAARKLFKALGVDYHSVDLDSVAYQEDNRGGKIRAVLARRIGSPTIPQIFVAGQYIGGCTELFNAHADGSLQRLLEDHGIRFDDNAQIDPRALLPQWVHPRKTA